MSYLPAPYESAQQDDLAAAVGAGLAVVTAGITSWITGRHAYDGIRFMFDSKADFADLPKELVVPTIGWSVGVVFMVLGALVLAFRKGRGALAFGALVSLVTTVVVQVAGWHTGIEQWPLYWGGAVVLVAALLPATGRWISGRAAVPAAPPTGGPTLWPGT